MPEASQTEATCTAGNPSGVSCESASLPGAPFPICMRHAAEVLRYLNAATQGHFSAASAAAAMLQATVDRRTDKLIAPGRGVEVVYYLRISRYIKIGYSGDLKTRIRFYPPDTELLALEFGGRELEARRLDQFRRDRMAAREWFDPSSALLQHIAAVARNGAVQAA